MSKKKKLTTLILLGAIVLVSIAAAIGNRSSNVPDGYELVKDYRHVEADSTTCSALMPQCGYCPGEVIDKACYVKTIDEN